MILSPERNRKDALSPARRKWKALEAGGLACAAALMSFFPPEGLPLPSCVFHELTGHSCLTCGLTRSLLASARGNLSVSLEYHLMGPLLFLGLLAAIVWLSAEALTGTPVSPLRAKGRLLRAAVTLVVGLWVTYGGIRFVLELAG